MRLDDLWASLFRAGLPPAPGLTADFCSYGREFATRFFQLHLAATPCVSLRLPSPAPIGSFHPIRFCPCWAHQTRPVSACPGLVGGRLCGWLDVLIDGEKVAGVVPGFDCRQPFVV